VVEYLAAVYPNRADEGYSVGVFSYLIGGFTREVAYRVVRQQERPNFLFHELWSFGSQYSGVGHLMGLDLVESEFKLSGKAGGLPRRPPLSTARAAFTASQRKQAAGAAWDCRVGGRVGE
jgi:hypothetical protein